MLINTHQEVFSRKENHCFYLRNFCLMAIITLRAWQPEAIFFINQNLLYFDLSKNFISVLDIFQVQS